MYYFDAVCDLYTHIIHTYIFTYIHIDKDYDKAMEDIRNDINEEDKRLEILDKKDVSDYRTTLIQARRNSLHYRVQAQVCAIHVYMHVCICIHVYMHSHDLTYFCLYRCV